MIGYASNRTGIGHSTKDHPLEVMSILTSPRIIEGRPFPLGASAEDAGTNFALFSANATKVELCLFDARGEREVERLELPEHTDGIWHGFVEGLRPGAIYGYRVYGPYEPENGHRFNHHKLLLDPYARAHFGQLTWDPAVFGYIIGDPRGDLSFDERDSAPFVPKSVVVHREEFSQERGPLGHRVSWDDTVFYEAHVRGYTKSCPKIPEHMRGTYAGLTAKEIVDHIASLGVTIRRAVADSQFRPRRAFARPRIDELLGLQQHRFLCTRCRLCVR